MLSTFSNGGVKWLIHLGGPGLILLGLADNSVVPLPGSMDLLTIWLAASHRSLWFYYAGMATAGAVLGGYLTYRIARRGGKATLERKFAKQRIDKMYAKFERWGFGAVAIPALLPPPFPIVPALLAAGAMQYPKKRFLTALALGRGIRFTVVAFLGAHYGRHIAGFLEHYYKPALVCVIALAAAGGVFAAREYFRAKKKRRESKRRRTPARPRAA